jgi:hypothetical protein
VPLRAVLFDVDFTLARPGPDLGPEGYRRMGEQFGLELDPARYPEARTAALATLERHPELRHEEELWLAFTERIVRGMGGDSDAARDLAVAMTRAWERSENFDLYDDVLPVLAALRGRLARARLDEAARVDLSRRPRPDRRRAGGRGDGRRLRGGRRRGRQGAGDACLPDPARRPPARG